MAKIIEFPRQAQIMSNGYHNLSRLIDLAESAAELEFYAEVAVVGAGNGHYFSGEFEKLGEQIRRKRLDLTKAK